LQRGAQVLVDGRLSQRRWDTPEGKSRSKYEVVANTVQFLSKTKADAEKNAEE
jgi:single-stranded DNA-binding protein